MLIGTLQNLTGTSVVCPQPALPTSNPASRLGQAWPVGAAGWCTILLWTPRSHVPRGKPFRTLCAHSSGQSRDHWSRLCPLYCENSFPEMDHTCPFHSRDHRKTYVAALFLNIRSNKRLLQRRRCATRPARENLCTTFLIRRPQSALTVHRYIYVCARCAEKQIL